MNKTKVIKRLYGGESQEKLTLYSGDVMYVDLLNESIKILLKEAYITESRISVLLTEDQLIQIKPSNNEFFAMIYWMPIKTYFSNSKIQVGYVKCNNKQINIYTYKE